MQKWILPTSTLAAMAVSFILFVFMANLISKPQTVANPPTQIRPDIDFELQKQQKDIPKVRTIKEQLKSPPPPPPTQTFSQPPDETPVEPTLDFQAPTLDIGTDINGKLGGTGGSLLSHNSSGGRRDSEAVAISRVAPFYPIPAMRRGIEGWVKLSFDVDKTGSVVNIRVIDADPKRVFDKAAIKALKRWRYKAKFIGGEAVMQTNQSVQLDFAID